MRFFNNGQMLYALNTVDPHEMANQLRNGTPEENKIYLGYYKLVGRNLEVEVRVIFLCLLILICYK